MDETLTATGYDPPPLVRKGEKIGHRLHPVDTAFVQYRQVIHWMVRHWSPTLVQLE